MAAQKAKARAAWAGSGEMADDTIWFDVLDNHGATIFLAMTPNKPKVRSWPWCRMARKWTVLTRALLCKSCSTKRLSMRKAAVRLVTAARSLQRVGHLEVTDCRKTADLFIHVAKVTKGFVEMGQAAELAVASERRARIRANHSATHLLHEALRRTLGEHVAQRGSLNADDRLRFDFSHGQALTATQLQQVQSEVNTLYPAKQHG